MCWFTMAELSMFVNFGGPVDTWTCALGDPISSGQL